MNVVIQLLLYAAADPSNDRFVFLSDSHIPILSFDKTYDEIMKDEKSRFCFNPLSQTQSTWSSLPELNIPNEDQRVASQWSILARDHVNLILRNLHTLNEWTQTSIAKVVKNGFNRGSADEKLLPTFLQTCNKCERLD